jgi:TonB family protein
VTASAKSEPHEDPVMRKRTEIAIWGTVVVASLGLHAVAFGGLGGARTDGFGKPKMKPATFVDVSIPKPKEAPPPPAPAKPAAQAPKLAMAHPARAKAAPPPSAPPPSAAPPPADESPADFSGVTMTNDGPTSDAGWASATGNGQAMKGAVGRPGAHVTHRNVEGTGEQLVRHPGPPVVAVADLSRRPVPPDLVEAIRQAYPADARAKGIPGKATVSVRLAPDGRGNDVKIVSASAESFGAACQSVLRGAPPWSPPVDRQGQAVSTVVNFTCRFEVQ